MVSSFQSYQEVAAQFNLMLDYCELVLKFINMTKQSEKTVGKKTIVLDYSHTVG